MATLLATMAPVPTAAVGSFELVPFETLHEGSISAGAVDAGTVPDGRVLDEPDEIRDFFEGTLAMSPPQIDLATTTVVAFLGDGVVLCGRRITGAERAWTPQDPDVLVITTSQAAPCPGVSRADVHVVAIDSNRAGAVIFRDTSDRVPFDLDVARARRIAGVDTLADIEMELLDARTGGSLENDVRVITSQDQLRDFYARHHPHVEAPEVDFEQRMVLAAHMLPLLRFTGCFMVVETINAPAGAGAPLVASAYAPPWCPLVWVGSTSVISLEITDTPIVVRDAETGEVFGVARRE